MSAPNKIEDFPKSCSGSNCQLCRGIIKYYLDLQLTSRPGGEPGRGCGVCWTEAHLCFNTVEKAESYPKHYEPG